jgi:hypothetical protein
MNQAITDANIHPINPALSAAICLQRRRSKINKIGDKANTTDKYCMQAS